METLNTSIQSLMNKIGQQEQKDSTQAEKSFEPVPRDMEERYSSFNCDIHGEVDLKQVYYNFCHDWLPRAIECKTCAEIERKRQQELQEKESYEKRQIDELHQAIQRIGIPLRFDDKTFDNFVITGKEKSTFTVCKSYAEKFIEIKDKGTSLILCGNTGAGKTHLACAIANHIVNNHKKTIIGFNNSETQIRFNIRFIEALKAIRTVKQTYSSKNKTEQDAIDELVAPDLLILDEVGVQFGSDAEKMILFEIMNERYLKMKPSIIISNLSVQALNEFIGERVIDRLKENNGRILAFDWESKRDGKF